jgi:YgiT-type zinc finger domain-containing protein
MTLSNQPENKTHACQCGGHMVFKTGTVVRVIRGKEIRIHHAPYYHCSSCDEIEYDLNSNISSIAVEAYKKDLQDVIYSTN